MSFNLNNIVRKNILELKPYSSARSEYTGKASVFLDANENAWGSPLPTDYSRYPDPLQWDLKMKIAVIKKTEPQNIVLGNGSDEIIDLAFRIFCEPQKDNVIICPPTYGMYAVAANINDVDIKKVPLSDSFNLNVEDILQAIDAHTKLIFICSPNNPTGNVMNRSGIEKILQNFSGVVILDEAYIDFCENESFIQSLKKYPNLLVIQTFSKAWGLAGLRLGMAFGSTAIINLFNKVKPPYNINEATQELALTALENKKSVTEKIRIENEQKEYLLVVFLEIDTIKKVYPSNSNFILVKVANANKLYDFLKEKEIIVRNRTNEANCENCLRITVGREEENKLLIAALKAYKD